MAPTGAYRLLLPADWQMLDLGEDSESSIDRLARDAVRTMDADSSAAARHRYKERLRAVVDSIREVEGTRVSVMYMPRPEQGSLMVPMTVSCGVAEGLDVPSEDATRFLVSMAQADPSAHPVDADGVVALRTLSIDEATDAAASEVAKVTAVTPRTDGVDLFQMRASYLFVQPGTSQWHLIVGSATVPDDDAQSPIVTAVLELFDSVVSTLRWTAKEVSHA